MVAAAHASVAVGRDERYAVGGRAGEAVGDDVRRELGHAPEPALLPRGHDRRDGCLVGHGRARGGEREPAARALTAAPHGPGRRRAAALAVRAEQERKRGPAVRAEILTQTGAGNATAGQQEVENHTASTLLRKSARVAHGSAPRVLLLERVFAARRESRTLAHQVVCVQELLRVADVHPVAGEPVRVDRLARVEPDQEVARCVG